MFSSRSHILFLIYLTGLKKIFKMLDISAHRLLSTIDISAHRLLRAFIRFEYLQEKKAIFYYIYFLKACYT